MLDKDKGKLKWEFYGKDKIIIGTTIFTLEELQNAVENRFKKDKDKIENLNKIAEFLAKNSVVRAKCERCVEDLDENGCIRCMLNWAKSEVLKNE